MIRNLIERLTKVRFGPRRKRRRSSGFHYGRLGGLRLESLEERALLASLTIEIAEASISENGGVASAFVSRDSGTSGDLVVNLTSSNESEATVPLTVTIPDGHGSASVTITGVDEQIVDLAKTVTITASADGFDAGSATIDVTNDDSATLSVADATVVEGDEGTTVLSFPVTLSLPVDVDISVDYTTQDGTASAADGDYVAVTTPAIFTINAGDTSGSIKITVNHDTLVEPDETLSVVLSNLQSKGRNVTQRWTQLGQDIEAANYVSLSSDGSTLVIGASFNDNNGTNSGQVRAYRFDGTIWTQLGQDIDGEAAGDRLGESVSLSSDGYTLAIGEPGNDTNGDYSGQTSVYRYDGTNWIQLGQDIDGGTAHTRSGTSVSLSGDGNTLLIGEPGGSRARVLRFDGTNWEQLGQDIDGEAVGDLFGRSVSLSGDGTTLASGAIFNDGNGIESGQARVYRFDGSNWNQLGQDIDGDDFHDRFGHSVALSGDGTTLVIGAPSATDRGQSRIYRFDGTNWTQLGQSIDGESRLDGSGWSASLNGGGNIVAVGAIFNRTNNKNVGHARVYRFDGGTWLQVGDDIDGRVANGFSLFGSSVALSGPGNTVAIGAGSGYARVYRLDVARGTIHDNDSLLVEFSQPTGMDVESFGGNLPQLLVTGTIQAGHRVTIDMAVIGGTAIWGFVDYSAPIMVTIPAGTYNATPFLIPGLSITPDTLIESDETIELGMLTGSQIQVGDADGDGTIHADTQYTIIDDDLQRVQTAIVFPDASSATITDTVTGGKDDQLQLTIVGNNLIITDANNILGNFADNTTGGMAQVPLNTLERVEINLAGGDDHVAIDFSGAPQDFHLSVTINGGDGHDTLTFTGAGMALSGGLETAGGVEDIFVDAPISIPSGTIRLAATQSLEVNADVSLGMGSIELTAGRDIFGNCSLIDVGDADVQLAAGTGIANVRVQTSGDVSLNAGSGGIVGCTGEIAVRAKTLTLVAGSSVGTALLTAGVVTDVAPLRTSVDTIQGTVGGVGIFLLNDRPLTDNVVLANAPPLGIRYVCPGLGCEASEGEATPLHNSVDQLDVNSDGLISPIDVLAVVNYLNSSRARGVGEGPIMQATSGLLGDLHLMYVDVNGDRSVSALDALIIINHLNQRTVVPAEGESPRDDSRTDSPDDNTRLTKPADVTASERSDPFPTTPLITETSSHRRGPVRLTTQKDDKWEERLEGTLDELAEDAAHVLLARQ